MRLILCSFLLIPSVHAAVDATVDRKLIRLGQNIQLNLSSDNALGVTPNLRGLKSKFSILGHSKISRPYMHNGKRRSKTLWYYILRPKFAGNLTIPPLEINGEKTAQINITVRANKKKTPSVISKKATANNPLNNPLRFKLNAAIDKNKVYPNQQVTYSLSAIYPKKYLGKVDIIAPFVPAAIITPLTQATHTPVNKKQHIKTEQTFAIYAEQPANYQIKPAAVEVKTSQTKHQRFNVNTLHFSVQEKANQTTFGYWIPSSSVKLKEHWEMPQKIVKGMTIYRTIELQVDAVDANILPLLATLTHENMRIKLIDVTVENVLQAGKTTAIRTEKIAYTLSQEGTMSMAPIDIHWWDITLDQAKVATLSAKSLIIHPKIVQENLQKDNLETINKDAISSQSDPISSPLPAQNTVIENTNIKINNGKKPSTTTDFQNIFIIFLTIFSLFTSVGWFYSNKKRNK